MVESDSHSTKYSRTYRWPMVARPRPANYTVRHSCTIICSECESTAECSLADLLRYARRGWPRCCGEVMSLFVEGGRHDVIDVTIERAGRPRG